jgi:menaquinol-cytochrome c reductase cytochrome b/c subunit
LRVLRNAPKFTDMATIGVPTLAMILLFLLPLYDRSPERMITRRPIALASGLATVVAIAFLTYEGAHTGSPNQVTLPPPPGLTAAQKATYNAGALVVGETGCLACHVIGENGNNGPGPPLTQIGRILRPGGISATLRYPTAPMPSFLGLARNDPQKFNNLVQFLSMLQ